MDLSFLMLGEVETRGSTQYVGEHLPQCKPSISRHDATSEEMEKFALELVARLSIEYFVKN